jgi:hypothetical protein
MDIATVTKSSTLGGRKGDKRELFVREIRSRVYCSSKLETIMSSRQISARKDVVIRMDRLVENITVELAHTSTLCSQLTPKGLTITTHRLRRS